MQNQKQEIIKHLQEKMEEGLQIKNNVTLSYIFMGLIAGKGALVMKDRTNDENSFVLEFKEIDGLIDIERYDCVATEDIIPRLLETATQGINESHKDIIAAVKHDLLFIEQTLMEVAEEASHYGYDIAFMFSEGLTYGYYESTDGTPILRVTMLLNEDEKGDVSVIFKYATDVEINVSYKNDFARRSSLRIK